MHLMDPEPPPTAAPARASIRAFVKRHERALWRYLRHLGCDPAAADELLQDSFVTALSSPFEDRGEAAAFAWLRGIARHAFLNARRADRREAERFCGAVEELWAGPDGLASTWDSEQDALQDCLQELDERARLVVRRFYGDGASRAEIAGECGMTENGVKTRLQRLRAGLRACIERRLQEEQR